MASSTRISGALIAATVAVLVIGCSKEEGGTAPPVSHSAPPPPTVSAAEPTPSAPAPSATAAAPAHECPEGTTGAGTLKEPCEAKGGERMMEVTWSGKMSDEGPSFRVTNKSTSTILYGKIAVYFYDKAGKQLELPDPGANPPKTRPNHMCSGTNLFGGVMKPGEKAVVTFSCVQKKHVPEGAVAIEGEIVTVGFADASEKKSEYYWRNNDLAPDVRPKGGVKASPKAGTKK